MNARALIAFILGAFHLGVAGCASYADSQSNLEGEDVYQLAGRLRFTRDEPEVFESKIGFFAGGGVMTYSGDVMPNVGPAHRRMIYEAHVPLGSLDVWLDIVFPDGERRLSSAHCATDPAHPVNSTDYVTHQQALDLLATIEPSDSGYSCRLSIDPTPDL